MKQAECLARQCLKLAKNNLGSGWHHFGPEIRVAMIRNYAWHIVSSQDDSIRDERIHDLIKDLDAELERIFDTEGLL